MKHSRIGLCLLVLVAVFLLKVGQLPVAMPLATIIQPDGVGDVVGGGNDFATVVLRDPWDMNEASDIWEVQNISDAVFDDGKLQFTAGNDSYFWLLHQGYESAQNIGKTGVAHPIDADHYHVFSFRMWSQSEGFAFVYWYKDQDVAKFAVTDPIPVSPGWHVYTVDLKEIGIQTGGGGTGWYGDVAGLRLNPYKQAGVSANRIEIDWVRLTPSDTTHSISIDWSGVSGSLLSFYLDEDTSGCDGAQIGVISSPAATGSFEWGASFSHAGNAAFPWSLPSAIAPGDYYVCGRDDSGSTFYSTGPLSVDQEPMLWFTFPDHLTGPDYATRAGVPWDMSSSNAFSWMNDIDSYEFSGGQFHATNTGGDPSLRLRTPVALDTSKYKYFTCRMYLEGEFDLQGGWVIRVLWYDQPSNSSTIDDIVIRPGWNTYTINLNEAILEPGSQAWSAKNWDWFRLDPNENIRGVPWNFHIDYVLLTGDPVAKVDSYVPIRFDLSEMEGVTVNLYYDSDTTPGGEVRMSEYTFVSPGDEFVYLPFVGRGSLDDLPKPSGRQVTWDTMGVPVGTYYILAEVNDGYNTTRWYSEVPIVLTAN